MSAGTVRAVVVHDGIVWEWTIPGTVPPKKGSATAVRGAEVDLPREVFDRLEGYGAVVAADDPEEVEEAQAARDDLKGPVAAGEEGDAYLASLSMADLVAYVGQHETEQDRVVALERQRAKPRQGVLKAAGAE